MEYHLPVLLKESVDALVHDPQGIYVDVTYGGGGHSREILKRLDAKGHLVSFDQDQDVLPELISENEHFTFVHQNFRFLKRYLKLQGFLQVDGILADLGVSSHQFDEASRGFSYRFDAPLDMRMDQYAKTNAAQILNTFIADELQDMFSKYGEIRNAKTLARHIVDQRKVRSIKTIGEFLEVLEPMVRGNKHKYLAQVFQALRIEVNQEISALEQMLSQAIDVLKPGGKLVVISYHSLEDRIVKNFMRTGNASGKHESDFYGKIFRPLKMLTKKTLLPSEEEIKQNPRARSARMRVAMKY
ncbi:MAG: 16S rRNA (cytosine(1402)-N(4))-methyltransferase RsmH [Saprospiraceae bacterium]|nr:16S rRNA (cytosine(1402)-N(4))-methyltransferase RsmH [Saprospiraceae bacterium]